MNTTQRTHTFPVKIALAAKLLAILSLVMVLVESKIPGMLKTSSLVSVSSKLFLSFELVNFDVWVSFILLVVFVTNS